MFLYIRRHGYYLSVDSTQPTKLVVTLERPADGLFITHPATGLLVLASDNSIVPRFKSYWDPPLGVRPKRLNTNEWCLECEEDDEKNTSIKYLGLWKESLVDTGNDESYTSQLHWMFSWRDSWEVYPVTTLSPFLQDYVSPLLPRISPSLAHNLVRLRVKPKLTRKKRTRMLQVKSRLIPFTGVKLEALESAIYAALYE